MSRPGCNAPIDPDDDLPPCIGERYRDVLHDILRAAEPAKPNQTSTNRTRPEDKTMSPNSQTITSTDDRGLIGIEQRCAVYRNRRDRLRQLAGAVNDAIEAIKAQRLPALRRALTDTADAESALRDAVRLSDPSLWRRTRSRIVHGVKIGWQKQRGRVEFDDEAKVIERIRRLLPADQAALLIRRRESVHKPAVYDLTAADLRRLGITVTDDSDQVVVRDMDSELDRALEALLADIAGDGAA